MQVDSKSWKTVRDCGNKEWLFGIGLCIPRYRPVTFAIKESEQGRNRGIDQQSLLVLRCCSTLKVFERIAAPTC
jgi:hypothetical protein